MNDKLNKWNGTWMEMFPNRHGSRGGTPSDALVILSTYKERSARSVLRISIHKKLSDLTGWIPGDRIQLELKDGMAFLYRSSFGPIIQKPNKKAGTRNFIRFSAPLGSLDDFPTGIATEVEAKPGRVAFLLPLKTV